MTRIKLVAVLLVTAVALPASAQVRVRDHRKRKPSPAISVSSFSPRSGAVGTQVTIRGRGFSPDTEVFFGGYEVRPTRVIPTAIEIAVPRRHGDGAIVLRHPGVARDIRVGTFVVVADPEVYGIAPASGVAGTRVAIRGTGFKRGDTVSMAGITLPIHRLNSTRIIVTIPDQARSARITVSRPGGAQSTSRDTFTVVQPAPAITSLHPASGPPGTTVRITGTSFTPHDRLFYGKRELRVAQRGPTFVDVVIPARARGSQHLWLSGPNGEARSPRQFRLERLPVIHRISQPYGTVGERVDIYGDNFRAGDRVTIDGLQLRILQLRTKQITAIIPNGAQSGPLVVERGAIRVDAPQVFDVVYAPVISYFTPTGGDTGTRVTIVGSSFTPDVEVFYGAKKLRVLKHSGTTSLEVKIPRSAKDQVFTIRTRGGDATSARAFNVYWWPQIADVQPRAAHVGSQVTLRGEFLDNVEDVYLGNLPMQILTRGTDGRTLVVEVPSGARRNRITYASFGRRFNTKFRLVIRKRPDLTGFSPPSGPPGSEVVVDGHNFTDDTAVYFGNTPMAVVRRALPNRLVVRIPQNARGADHLWVEALDARIRSRHPLVIVAPPSIAGFTPRGGKPGTEVTINGQDMGADVEILIGQTPCPILARKGNSLAVQIPVGVPAGKQHFWIRDKNLVSKSAHRFKVLPAAFLSSFEPLEGPPGTEITLHGRHFGRATRVFFGDIELRIRRVDRRGKRMRVVLPAAVTGAAYLIVDDDGVRSQSSVQFRVLQPPPPPPPPPPRDRVRVRDHRKK